MSNIYVEFFSELKYYLIKLGIDNNENIAGCSESEIAAIEEKIKTKLPLSYREYLKSIGKYHLFEFFDAEQMSYEDFEDINGYVNWVLKDTEFKFDKKYFPISHRRDVFGRFIFLDESDNPNVWFLKKYPNNIINIENSNQNFTQMILDFFD